MQTFKQMKGKSHDGDIYSSGLIDDIVEEPGDEDDSEDEFETDENSKQKYLFLDSHPGYKFSYLQQRKHVAIPIISVPKGNIC